MTPTRPSEPAPMPGTVKDSRLLIELAAREAGRRKHQNWRRVPAAALIEVLEELGFAIEVTRS